MVVKNGDDSHGIKRNKNHQLNKSQNVGVSEVSNFGGSQILSTAEEVVMWCCCDLDPTTYPLKTDISPTSRHFWRSSFFPKWDTVCYREHSRIFQIFWKEIPFYVVQEKTVTFKKAAVLKVFGDEKQKTLLRDPYT